MLIARSPKSGSTPSPQTPKLTKTDRRQINRTSAQKHRARRKEELDILNRQLAERDARIAKLERELAVEKAKSAQLADFVRVQQYQTSGSGSGSGFWLHKELKGSGHGEGTGMEVDEGVEDQPNGRERVEYQHYLPGQASAQHQAQEQEQTLGKRRSARHVGKKESGMAVDE